MKWMDSPQDVSKEKVNTISLINSPHSQKGWCPRRRWRDSYPGLEKLWSLLTWNSASPDVWKCGRRFFYPVPVAAPPSLWCCEWNHLWLDNPSDYLQLPWPGWTFFFFKQNGFSYISYFESEKIKSINTFASLYFQI